MTSNQKTTDYEKDINAYEASLQPTRECVESNNR